MHPCRAEARGAGQSRPFFAESYVEHHDERDLARLARILGVSVRRLRGWEPEERHKHFDPDGNLTGYTMVTREPEWDDDERDRLLGLALYESGLCECGLHQMQLDDPVNHPHTIETTMCKVCAAIETHQRVQADEDAKAVERLGKRPSPKVARPTDGRRVFLRPAPVSALAGDGN